jgi:DNA-binding transcriptional regulator YhcF (GntR family)
MAKRRRRGRPPGPSSRRSAIQADILEKLSSGEWPVGKPIPSYRQLAEKYQVSVTTIRLTLKSLAREGRLSIHSRKKPVASIGKSLNEMLDGAVAIVLKDQLAHYVRGVDNVRIWRGLTLGLLRTNSPFIVLQHWKLWRTAFPAGLHELPICGIVLLGPFRLEMIKQYESFKVPVVLIDQPGEQFKIHSVSVSNYQAAFDATSRMLSMGHTRIAFVRSVLSSMRDIDPDARERQEGFLAACKQGGLKQNQCKVVSAILESTSHSVEDLIRTTPRYTAVLCSNERHAVQTENAALAADLKIPRDLSIVTFQSDRSDKRDWTGPQTDFEGLGQKAAEILFRRPEKPEHALVPPKWSPGATLKELR